MTFLLKIIRYNDVLAAALALFLNLLLLFLIITVKKVELKRISFVLLPSCFIDLLLSLVTFVIAPQVFNIKFTAYIITESLLSFSGFKAANITLWIYASIVITNMNSICIPFYLRYLVICRDITLTLKHLILPYIIIFIIFISTFISLIWCFPIKSEISKELRAPTLKQFWLEEYSNGPIFVAANIDSISFIIPYSFIIISTVISYAMLLLFCIKITKRLQSHVSNYSGSKVLNKQIHKTLIIQAIGPFLVANVPIFSIVAMIFLKIENLTISLCFSFFVGWIPIVNPLAAIIIIEPFKAKVFGIFKKIKQKINVSFVST